jgi:hypothetical protein
MSLEHVYVHYVPCSGIAVSQVVKPATDGVCSRHNPDYTRCFTCEINLKYGQNNEAQSAVYNIKYILKRWYVTYRNMLE